MKNANCPYKAVPDSKVSNLVSAADPLNSTRLPIGVKLKVHPQIFEVPASGSIANPWQAIKLTDASDECYFVSPRVFAGLAWFERKFSRVMTQPFPAGSILDYIKTQPEVEVVSYNPCDVDVFGSNPLEQVTREMPLFKIAA
jgi:hypothetical protein